MVEDMAILITDENDKKFNPGKYWIGDLCYIFSRSIWQEICQIICDRNTQNLKEYIIQLNNGIKIAILSTSHGDGTYLDNVNQNNEYFVDSGTIGCILQSDINIDSKNIDLGNIHDIDDVFSPNYNKGDLYFGNIIIFT